MHHPPRYRAESARALETALFCGASYAEIRFDDEHYERASVRNGTVDDLLDGREAGYGIRALVDGAWGFAASQDLRPLSLDATANRAVELARAAASVSRRPQAVAPTTKIEGSYTTPYRRHTKEVGLEERLRLLHEAEAALHVDPAIRVGRAWVDTWQIAREYANTLGSSLTQRLLQTGSGIAALASDGDDTQIRSAPGEQGLYQSGGWEIVEAAALRETAPRIAEEAVQLLKAPPCPVGHYDLILGGSQVSLQIHESLGHAAELDRILGWEASFSGTSFLRAHDLGQLRYASPVVTILIDTTLPGGLSTVGYDDEGTPSRAEAIVQAGMLVGFETSRDTAPLIGRESNACMRSESWRHVPLIRMGNLNLVPGTQSLEELIDGVDSGLYFESNRSWSIDDRRLNFQFGCQIGWEIVRGKRRRIVKNPTYGGVTPHFWNSCDAVGDQASWVAWGTPNCGKGEPLQTGRTTQAASPARFRRVAVGVGYDG